MLVLLIVDHSKAFLQDQIVLVNGETEQRRGRKLYSGFAVIVGKEVL